MITTKSCNAFAAILLVLSSIALVNAQDAQKQTLGALKGRKQRPQGAYCGIPGQAMISTDQQSLVLEIIQTIDSTMCYSACLANPNCVSLVVTDDITGLDYGCGLLAVGPDDIGFTRDKNSQTFFTTRDCLTSTQVDIKPPVKSCAQPGNPIALRISAPNDWRNGFWVNVLEDADSNQYLSYGPQRDSYFTIDSTTNALTLTNSKTIATYDNNISTSPFKFELPSSYQPEERLDIPIKCAVQGKNRLSCRNGDPELTTTPKSFGFSLCTYLRSDGYPFHTTYPLQAGRPAKKQCDLQYLPFKTVVYYGCF